MKAGGCDPESGRLQPASLLSCGSNTQIVALWGSAPELEGVDVGPVVLEVFRDQSVNHPAPVTDLPALFRRLKARGLQLGIATMDGTESARQSLVALGIDGFVDFLAGHDAGFGVKPDPGLALAFTRASDLQPAEVWMVGDASRDLEMARRAGFGARVGVLTGAADRAALAPHADAVLDDISSLEDLLDRGVSGAP